MPDTTADQAPAFQPLPLPALRELIMTAMQAPLELAPSEVPGLDAGVPTDAAPRVVPAPNH